MRLPLSNLILPNYHRMVDSAGVREDAHDIYAYMPVIGQQIPRRTVSDDRVGNLFDRLKFQGRSSRMGPQREWKDELHPPADVDECVRDANLLDELVDREFLLGPVP